VAAVAAAITYPPSILCRLIIIIYGGRHSWERVEMVKPVYTPRSSYRYTRRTYIRLYYACMWGTSVEKYILIVCRWWDRVWFSRGKRPLRIKVESHGFKWARPRLDGRSVVVVAVVVVRHRRCSGSREKKRVRMIWCGKNRGGRRLRPREPSTTVVFVLYNMGSRARTHPV